MFDGITRLGRRRPDVNTVVERLQDLAVIVRRGGVLQPHLPILAEDKREEASNDGADSDEGLP